ncbi:MAG: hypothetical protein WC508_00180 [Patescibacteria group bacterium]
MSKLDVFLVVLGCGVFACIVLIWPIHLSHQLRRLNKHGTAKEVIGYLYQLGVILETTEVEYARLKTNYRIYFPTSASQGDVLTSLGTWINSLPPERQPNAAIAVAAALWSNDRLVTSQIKKYLKRQPDIGKMVAKYVTLLKVNDLEIQLQDL